MIEIEYAVLLFCSFPFADGKIIVMYIGTQLAFKITLIYIEERLINFQVRTISKRK